MSTYVAVTSGMKPGDSYEFEAFDDRTARSYVSQYLYQDERVTSLVEVTGPTTVRPLFVDNIRPFQPEPEEPNAFSPRPFGVIPGAMSWSPRTS